MPGRIGQAYMASRRGKKSELRPGIKKAIGKVKGAVKKVVSRIKK